MLTLNQSVRMIMGANDIATVYEILVWLLGLVVSVKIVAKNAILHVGAPTKTVELDG